MSGKDVQGVQCFVCVFEQVALLSSNEHLGLLRFTFPTFCAFLLPTSSSLEGLSCIIPFHVPFTFEGQGCPVVGHSPLIFKISQGDEGLVAFWRMNDPDVFFSHVFYIVCPTKR